MSTKEDLRVQRTRKLLSDTLLDMMEKQSIEQISVIDLCNAAMVNRATFYKHFDDKYALLGFALNETKRELYANFTFNDCPVESPQESVKLLISSTIDFFFNNRNRIAGIVRHNPHGKVISAMEDCISAAICYNINTYVDKYAPKVPLTILAQFLAGGIVSTILWCVANPDEFSQDEFKTCMQIELLDSVFEKI